MSLARALLDFDRDNPGDPDAEMLIPAETWAVFVKLAWEEEIAATRGTRKGKLPLQIRALQRLEKKERKQRAAR